MAYRGADPTAVMGVRIGAYLLDAAVAAVVLGVLGFALLSAAAQTAPGGTVRCPDGGAREPGEPVLCLEDGPAEVRFLTDEGLDDLTGDLVLASGLLTVVNHVLLQGLVGASVGKLVLGLRVVRPNGDDAGLARCLLRTVLLVVDAFACAAIGLFTSFTSRGHRRVGDMVADTLVVSRRDQDALILARSGLTLPDRTTMAATSWASDHAPGTAANTGPDAGAPASPTWDAVRDTYVHYDRERGIWLAWDDATNTWVPAP